MGHTVGEETLIESKSNKRDSCYAHSETYLLDFNKEDWSKIKDIMYRTGNKNDFLLLEKLIK